MALETFNFCPGSLVPETVPPEPASVITMNGWEFSQRPAIPYRRKFKVTLHGLRWYLDAAGLYDAGADPTRNARALELFYQAHERWREFLWTHPHLGQLTVKFATAVAVPAAIGNSGGLVSAIEVQLIESNPAYS